MTVGMLILYCLLYADDVLLLSRSAAGLQAQLDTVVRFGRDKGLALNSDKSKVLKLGKQSPRKDHDMVISVEGKALEVVDIFKYLGTHVTEGGVNKKTLERRFQDGMEACMTMVQQSDRSGLRHPVVRCGIFKSLVLPVLSYGVECWGPMVLQRDLYGEDNQAERIWKRYLKVMLGLPTSVPGPSVLAEVGQYPVSFHWVRQVLRFFNTVLLSPEDTLVHQALMDNLALYRETQDQCRPTRSGAVHNGSQCWIGDVFKMVDQLGVDTKDRTLPRQVDIKTMLHKWVEEYTHRVSSEASRAREGRQAKYFALRQLDTDTLDMMASYLKSSGPPRHKQALLAFRLGVAGLAGTTRSTRLKDQECEYCDAQGVLIDQRTPLEGEAHVLYECGLYEGLRQDYKRLFEHGTDYPASFARACCEHPEESSAFMYKCLRLRSHWLATHQGGAAHSAV